LNAVTAASAGCGSGLLRLISIEVRGERNLVAIAPPVLEAVGGLKTTAVYRWASRDCFEMSLKELTFVGDPAKTKGLRLCSARALVPGDKGSKNDEVIWLGMMYKRQLKTSSLLLPKEDG